MAYVRANAELDEENLVNQMDGVTFETKLAALHGQMTQEVQPPKPATSGARMEARASEILLDLWERNLISSGRGTEQFWSPHASVHWKTAYQWV